EELKRGHPRDAKVALARAVVARFHGAEAAQAAQDHFERVIVRKERPKDVEQKRYELPADQSRVPLAVLLADTGLAGSRGEARRLIAQGGVSVGGERVGDPQAELGRGIYEIKVGKRRFLTVEIA
ncbi:MAG TPA: S4 domain-containing protein, partial [Fredinandcohnia sp.]|nr:S4 domain-containing protein [Fredinandcohnia sp.]